MSMKYSSETHVSANTPSLDELHDMLDKLQAWSKPYWEFHKMISERVEGSHRTVINYDQKELKDRWDTVQYTRKRYSPK